METNNMISALESKGLSETHIVFATLHPDRVMKALRQIMTEDSISFVEDRNQFAGLSGLTQDAVSCLKAAREEAFRFKHVVVNADHLLLGMLKHNKGLAIHILNQIGIHSETFRSLIEDEIRSSVTKATSHIENADDIPFSQEAREIIGDISIQESQMLGLDGVGTECILLGILLRSKGVAKKHMKICGVDTLRVKKDIQNFFIKCQAD